MMAGPTKVASTAGVLVHLAIHQATNSCRGTSHEREQQQAVCKPALQPGCAYGCWAHLAWHLLP